MNNEIQKALQDYNRLFGSATTTQPTQPTRQTQPTQQGEIQKALQQYKKLFEPKKSVTPRYGEYMTPNGMMSGKIPEGPRPLAEAFSYPNWQPQSPAEQKMKELGFAPPLQPVAQTSPQLPKQSTRENPASPNIGKPITIGETLKQFPSALGQTFKKFGFAGQGKFPKGMSAAEKAKYFFESVPEATWKTAVNYAKMTPRAFLRLGADVADPFIHWIYKAETPNLKPAKIPGIGEIPTSRQLYKQYRDSGLSPLTSGLLTGSDAAMNLAIVLGWGEYFTQKVPVKVKSGEVRIVREKTPKGLIKKAELGKINKANHPIIKKARYYKIGDKAALEVIPTKEGTLQMTGFDITRTRFQNLVKKIAKVGFVKTTKEPTTKALILSDKPMDLAVKNIATKQEMLPTTEPTVSPTVPPAIQGAIPQQSTITPPPTTPKIPKELETPKEARIKQLIRRAKEYPTGAYNFAKDYNLKTDIGLPKDVVDEAKRIVGEKKVKVGKDMPTSNIVYLHHLEIPSTSRGLGIASDSFLSMLRDWRTGTINGKKIFREGYYVPKRYLVVSSFNSNSAKFFDRLVKKGFLKRLTSEAMSKEAGNRLAEMLGVKTEKINRRFFYLPHSTYNIFEITDKVKNYNPFIDLKWIYKQAQRGKVGEKEIIKKFKSFYNQAIKQPKPAIKTEAPKPQIKPQIKQPVKPKAGKPQTAEAQSAVERIASRVEKEQTIIDNLKEQEGSVTIPPVIKWVSELGKRIHDEILTFGEVKRLDRDFYNALMESFSKRNAGIEKAIDELAKTKIRLSSQEMTKLALIYEDKRLTPPPELKDAFNKFKAILDKVQEREQAEGILRQTFQERMVAENEAKITKLKEQLKYPSRSKRLKRLIDENIQIANMRYLPHDIVVKRVLEAKIEKLQGKERQVFLKNLSRISARFKKRTGRVMLKDYIEAGIISPKDANIVSLTAQALSDYYYRSAINDLYQVAEKRGYIKPRSKELINEGWYGPRDIGITSPELKGKLIHPLFASSLAEMKAMNAGPKGFVRRMVGTVKMAQFIKPQIIWIYNGVQKFMRGMYANPITETRELVRATKTVINKTEDYHRLNALNLYQFPYEVSRASRQAQVRALVRKMSKDVPKTIARVERVLGHTLTKEEFSARNLLMVGTDAIAQATWLGDRIQRTQSYYILRRMGYSEKEAVRVASQSHGGYSVLSPRYKKALQPFVFVYSFRVLMPIEMAKIATEPIKGMIDWARTGKRPPKYKVNRWAKAIVATILIPVLIDLYMRSRGFKKIGKHLGPLAWKYRKIVRVNGKKRELIVGMNYILNMPIKYWNRLTAYSPTKEQPIFIQVILNTLKWELTPLWRILFYDVARNQRSFGSGTQVYDPNASPVLQLAQIGKYVFTQSYRFWGGMMDAAGEAGQNKEERQLQKAVYAKGLNKFDNVLLTIFGYKYVRLPVEERRKIMRHSLKKEYKTRGYRIKRQYSGKKRREQLKRLHDWARNTMQLIRKMK